MRRGSHMSTTIWPRMQIAHKLVREIRSQNDTFAFGYAISFETENISLQLLRNVPQSEAEWVNRSPATNFSTVDFRPCSTLKHWRSSSGMLSLPPAVDIAVKQG